MVEEPRPPRVPVGFLAVFGLLVALFGLFWVGGLVMGAPALWPACFFWGGLLVLGSQLLMAKILRVPIRGPAEPMGPPPDEE